MQRADQRKFHYLYKITRNDGRFYIGMHSTDNLEDGYFGSGKLITRSIKKHGIDIHTKEILEFLPSRQSLKDREKEILTEDLRADTKCMNIAPGGGGGFNNIEHQKKCAMAGGKVGGIVAMNKLNANPEIRKKSFATRQKNGSLATFGMLGKNHSVAAKEKMSLAGSGEKNSQYGSCWVTDGVKPIKIKKENLDEYLLNGYLNGRKVSVV